MCNSNKLVSVIIPTHNRGELLVRAIKSVLNQTYKPIEIIVVDDGSKDNTEEIICELISKFNTIKYIRHEKSLGGNAARNTGIKNSAGSFIAGLDDDDEFMPNRIQVLMSCYSDKYSLIASRSILMEKDGFRKTKYMPEVDLNAILYSNWIGNQVLVKRNVIVGAGMFDENLKRSQDYDMWLRIIEKYGNAKVINKVTQLIHYEHDISLNNNAKNTFLGVFGFYKKHKHKMTKCHRRTHLCRIFILQEKRMSLKFIRVFVSINTIRIILKYIVRGSLIKNRQ